jgi:RHS repeat-associated protein
MNGEQAEQMFRFECMKNKNVPCARQHDFWGRDLSGSLQGAGGVGGLLAVSLNGAWYFPLFDANGNITAYVDEQGVIVAEYTYDAFGGTIAKSGSMADALAHRFSTKYHDAETGLYYYGCRFYSPELMRWLNRDPIGERGGKNLNCFCLNNSLLYIDPRGKAAMNWGDGGGSSSPEPFLPLLDPLPSSEDEINDMFGDGMLWPSNRAVWDLYSSIDGRYIELRNKLLNQLQAMCPREPTSWGETKSGAAKCCTPRECMVTAEKIADAYINALEEASKARKVPGGDLGNALLYWWARLPPTDTRDQISNYYPNDPGRLSPGLVCTGWQQLALDTISPIIKHSPCWNYKPKSREKTVTIKKITFRYYHEWGAVNVMDGPDLDLDPWPSGGWHYPPASSQRNALATGWRARASFV